jgi:hypothetical protein
MRVLPAIRLTAGALAGASVWAVCALLLPHLPPVIRFYAAWLLFTFGPGAAAGARLTRDLDPLTRVIVLLAFGSAATPVLVVLLGYAHLLAAYPYVVTALAGVGLALWRSSDRSPAPRTSARDAWACAAIVAIALVTGAVAFWHRLAMTGGVQVFGLYDTMDLSYYAVMAAEAAHTVPPMASFYSGHALNAAYYPQLILTEVHRFADVPLLLVYFRYAWPAFLSLGALTAFVLIRSLTPAGVAFLAVVLMLVGGDFSYLAAWLLPHATDQWDFLLWPTNFFSPTMEVLHFNTWTPTLPVFFGALYATVRALKTKSPGWTVAAALLLPALFQFKPFAFMVIVAALFAAAVFAGRDGDARRRLGMTLGLGVLLTLPFAYSVATQADRRSRFLIDLFLLPRRMLLKLDLTAWADAVAARVAPVPLLHRPILLAIATGLFFAGGLGIRWIGMPGVWRAIRRRSAEDASAWSLLGWMTAAGILIPFVLVTDPYVDTLQFYQTGLYVLWIFTAVALVGFARRRPAVGAVAIALAIAVSLPSSLHFLHTKWTDDRREPRVALSRGEVAIANYLQAADPVATVVLHDRPAQPSLIAILSERRVVLGWGHPYYAVGSAGRLNDINAFYESTNADPRATYAMLDRYHVTHVIVADRNHVHPGVLARLQPLVRFPDVTLYAVPGRVPAS